MEYTPLDVAIIGAGFSGICMGIQLRQAGVVNFKIFEKTNGISGTWYDNTYPGAACDIPSHLYCYSFEPNPNWSRVYSPQKEIKAYVEKCAQKYHIKPHIHFKSKLVWAKFDEKEALWHMEFANSDKIATRILVSGAGVLNRPLLPDIPGIENFKTKFHSFWWDHDYNFSGKKIAVIGSAASAIQIIPTIAPKVKQLYVFQRTANYIVPRNDRAYSAFEKTLFHSFPFLLRFLRYFLYCRQDSRFVIFRKNSLLGKFMQKQMIAHMRRQVLDPKNQEKLTPNYPIGCKRVLLSDDYYNTINRNNVHLITKGIDHITDTAIVTKDNIAHEIDCIVLATGFRATDLPEDTEIIAPSGVTLNQAWKEGAEAYRGVSVAGFPNFFILLGPNTGLGHNSVIFMLEAQVRYIMQCIKKLENNKYLDVLPEAMRHYNNRLQEEFKNMVWDENCPSWYKTANGKNTTLWTRTTTNYWLAMRRPNFHMYKIVKH